MVWNGVPIDVGRPAGSGGSERSDLRIVVFGDVGRNSLHGPHDFWRGGPCRLCGGDFKPTSVACVDKSYRRLLWMKDFYSFVIERGNSVYLFCCPHREWGTHQGVYRYL